MTEKQMAELAMLEMIASLQCSVTMLNAAQQYIMNIDGCSKQAFLEHAAHAYDSTESQMILHVNLLAKKRKLQ